MKKILFFAVLFSITICLKIGQQQLIQQKRVIDSIYDFAIQMTKDYAAKPDTVPYVDIKRYFGKWYEQALIPFYWERGCSKTTATYSLNNNGSIRVDNACMKDGKLVQNIGHAVPEDKTNAKLKVQFVQTLDIGGQYWVVRLGDGEDYTYSVVSSPDYKLLWILYRQPVMPNALYESIVEDLRKAGGFQVNKLVRTQQ